MVRELHVVERTEKLKEIEKRKKKKKGHFTSEFWKKTVGEAIFEEIKSEGELRWGPSA